jgi:hypothetical protein
MVKTQNPCTVAEAMASCRRNSTTGSEDSEDNEEESQTFVKTKTPAMSTKKMRSTDFEFSKEIAEINNKFEKPSLMVYEVLEKQMSPNRKLNSTPSGQENSNLQPISDCCFNCGKAKHRASKSTSLCRYCQNLNHKCYESPTILSPSASNSEAATKKIFVAKLTKGPQPV